MGRAAEDAGPVGVRQDAARPGEERRELAPKADRAERIAIGEVGVRRARRASAGSCAASRRAERARGPADRAGGCTGRARAGTRFVRDGFGCAARDRNEGSGAGPEPDEALRGELRIRTDDDAARDAEVGGERPGRGQPRPGGRVPGRISPRTCSSTWAERLRTIEAERQNGPVEMRKLALSTGP